MCGCKGWILVTCFDAPPKSTRSPFTLGIKPVCLSSKFFSLHSAPWLSIFQMFPSGDFQGHLLRKTNLKLQPGTSVAVQRLRIHLPMQGTQIPSVVQEDPTWLAAAKPVYHNYWACTPEPVHQEEPPQREARTPQPESSPCSPQWEKAQAQQWRCRAAKNKTNKKFKKG